MMEMLHILVNLYIEINESQHTINQCLFYSSQWQYSNEKQEHTLVYRVLSADYTSSKQSQEQ